MSQKCAYYFERIPFFMITFATATEKMIKY